MRDARWIRHGWHTHPKLRAFPTLTRPCPVRRPRFGTPGVQKATEFAKKAWVEDEHRRPPLHYERRHQLLAGSQRRYKDYNENELLHFYQKDHTFHCQNAKQRRVNPQGFADERGQLLGNCFHAGEVAFLLAELLYDLGWLEAPLDLDELMELRVRLRPKPSASPLASTVVPVVPTKGADALLRLLRWLFIHQGGRGGEIRCLGNATHRRLSWQEIDVDWFKWSTAISVPWKTERDHINVCEARARLLGIKWRSRDVALHNRRYLALMDSQVNLSHAAKGRTSSVRMGHVEKQASSYLIATGMREINGYTRSDKNVADHPSRDRAAWARHRSRSRSCRRSAAASVRAAEPAGRARVRPAQ